MKDVSESPSSLLLILQLREEFDRGVEVQLDEEYSVHDVAALLKEFLRDMPDPLLTKELYTAFINTTCKLHCPFFPLSAWPWSIILLSCCWRTSSFLSHPIHPNLCYSVRPRWATECHSATGLPAPSMQQWHSPSPPWVPVHRDQPRPRPAGQRRTGSEQYFPNYSKKSCNKISQTSRKHPNVFAHAHTQWLDSVQLVWAAASILFALFFHLIWRKLPKKW